MHNNVPPVVDGSYVGGVVVVDVGGRPEGRWLRVMVVFEGTTTMMMIAWKLSRFVVFCL